ncbi:hypothetical protein [Bradyrhizobium sp. CB3481]|uniref:hypothetical protein n=1 Tax=Bradyrhizobium sp. CB3481 TaxID=3039158 RepID=UPI0024B27A2C|nr:hypothetical protein [Bradyrhizobium sp. CB3481]WFU14897.1 hypothetical protein QA643_28330 [Bradyrhizobium sp. CB3481]
MINHVAGIQHYLSVSSADTFQELELSWCVTLMLILKERHGIYKTQMQSEEEHMAARNNVLKDMNSALETLRANKPTNPKKSAPYGAFTDWHGNRRDIFEWMVENGIPIENNKRDKLGMQLEFEAAINNIKARVDSANSEGQMDLIYLQALMDKLHQGTELMSNVISKDQRTNETIIGNMR